MYKMAKGIANACFASGIDCSQVVFGYAVELIGLNPDEARKIASPFGGGMWLGETCGCVTGALMSIGYRYGHCQAGDTKAKETMLAKKAEFEKAFKAKHRSLICKESLGYNLTSRKN